MALRLLQSRAVYNIDWGAIRSGANEAALDHTAPAREEPAPRRWSRISPVVWSLGFTSLLTDVSSEMVSSVLPIYLLLHLHVSPAALGVIDGLYQGFALLVRVGAGIAGDRWRRHKAVALCGYALSAVCRIGLLAVGSAWTGIAAVIAADRVGKGIRTAPRDALISLSTSAPDLARAFGVHRTLDAAGALLGPLAAFAVLAWQPNGYDVLFVISFGVGIVGAGVLAIFVTEQPRTRAASDSAAPAAGAIVLLRDATLHRLTFAAGVLSLATVSDSFVFLSLQQTAGFHVGLFPLLFVAVALVNFACASPFGRLADRVGRVRVFLAGHVCLLGVYATLLLAPAIPGSAVLCLALLGAYYAATDGVLAALASSVLPPASCGSGLAIVASATNLGRLGGSILFGAAWAAWGLRDAMLVFTIALGTALIGATLLLRASSTAHAGQHSS